VNVCGLGAVDQGKKSSPKISASATTGSARMLAPRWGDVLVTADAVQGDQGT
jgi:hypothetical protein